jgi:hypothetical protein
MRNSSTSSFKRYLGRLLWMQVVLLLAFASTTIALVRYVVEPNDTFISRLELVKNSTATNAAFGDSHVVWGIVGSPEFIILGTEGETIADVELRVLYYFRDKSPGKVIVQGDPHSFSPYKIERGSHAYLQDMGASFWQRFLSHHRQYLGQYWGKVIANRSLRVFRPKYEIRWGWIVGKDRWSSVDPVMRGRQSASRVRRQTPIEEFQRHDFAESYRRTLAFLKRRGAEICVVTMPVSYDYYTQVEGARSTASAIRFFRDVATQNDVRYVNFFGRYAEPQFDSYFTDEDHLNEIGASSFTKELLPACFEGRQVEGTQGRP